MVAGAASASALDLPKPPSPGGVTSADVIPTGPVNPFKDHSTSGDHVSDAGSLFNGAGNALAGLAAVQPETAPVTGPLALGAKGIGYGLQGTGWVMNNGNRLVGSANAATGNMNCGTSTCRVSDLRNVDLGKGGQYWRTHDIHEPNSQTPRPEDTVSGLATQMGHMTGSTLSEMGRSAAGGYSDMIDLITGNHQAIAERHRIPKAADPVLDPQASGSTGAQTDWTSPGGQPAGAAPAAGTAAGVAWGQPASADQTQVQPVDQQQSGWSQGQQQAYSSSAGGFYG
jgi:hypothetical protein